MERFGLLKEVCIIFVVYTGTSLASAAQITTLHSFDSPEGSTAALIQATDGNFYGTTVEGGASTNCGSGCGTVFKITPAGTLTTLHSFDSTDGAYPFKGLIQATNGNFYGETQQGGTYNDGTVFKITPEGVLTTLHSFDGTDGDLGLAGLVQATDGNLYGTTFQGGAHGGGTVFKMTTVGALTTLYSFCAQTNCVDGSGPAAGLIQATDGNFYGTTCCGGAFGDGTVFKITPGGVLTTLHSFDGTEGADPEAGLIQATDGNFYGMTVAGGAYRNCPTFVDCGTVFKMTPSGMLTTLHSFKRGTGGSVPLAGLIHATDGNLYGTTFQGGTNCPSGNCGTIFEITPEGTLETLYSFCAQTNCVDGADPEAGLIQATDGNFYGTTSAGGAPGNYGTVFRFPVVQRVTLMPTSVGFGNTVINTTSVATVTVANTGSVMLEISSITASANFEVSSTTCSSTVAVGKKCFVNVKFTPTAPGKVAGTLTFTDNASNSPQTVVLSGIGIEAATLFPDSVTYAAQTVGTTSLPKTLTLANHQTVALNNIMISTTGNFAISTTTCTTSLAAKGKCTINVTFTPTAKGTRTGQLRVRDSASNSPQTSNLTGTGK